MNIDNHIESIRNEVGKSRSDRGLKVRQAAIKFEQRFGSEIFTAEQFAEWIKAEPEMGRFKDLALARRALAQAGTRTDLPKNFEIVRIGKSSWVLHPPENYFVEGRFPKALAAFLQNENRHVKKILQAVDWDHLDRHTRLLIVSQYRFYKAALNHMQIATSEMRMALDDMNSDFLTFGRKDLTDGETQS